MSRRAATILLVGAVLIGTTDIVLSGAATAAPRLGDGPRFPTWTGYSVDRSPTAVEAGDFTGDGAPDVAYARHDWVHAAQGGGSFGNTLTLQVNLGDGTMGAPVALPATDESTDLRSGDIDNDGDLDLVASAEGLSLENPTVDVYRNDGIGGFGRTTATLGHAAQRLALSDLDGDGNLDLASANGWGAAYASVALGDGTGSFGAEQRITIGSGQSSIAAADFDGDGDGDLAVARHDPDTNAGEIALIRNDDGNFVAGPVEVLTDDPFGQHFAPTIAAGDMDGDGAADLVAGGYDAVSYELLHNDGGLAFSVTSTATVGFGPVNLTLVDKDGDGDLDVYAATQGSSFTGDVSYLPNDGGAFGTPAVIESSHQPVDVAVADFNSDGRTDLAVANQGSATGAIHPGETGAALEAPPTYPTFGAPDTVAVADFDGDGAPDVASTVPSAGLIDVKLNDGAGSLVPTTTIPSAPGNPTSIWSADLDGDSLPDLLWTPSPSARMFAFALNEGAGSFAAAVTVPVDTCGVGRVTTADVDNDGDQDVLFGTDYGGCTDASGTGVSVSRNDGTAGFADDTFVELTYEPTMVLGADMNGDGLTDLVGVSDSAAGDLAVALGTGSGAFADPVASSTGAGHAELTVADLDADGDLDVATTNSSENTSVLLNDGTGQLGTPATLHGEPVPFGNEVAITTGDVDSDGDLDIAVANRTGKDMGVYYGHGDGTFEVDEIRYGMHSDLTDIELADMNADGRLDAVGPTDPLTAQSGAAARTKRTTLAAAAVAPAAVSTEPGVSVLINAAARAKRGLLVVHRAGTGTGTVLATDVGIRCGNKCVARPPLGAQVTLTARAGVASVFAEWSGPCTNGTTHRTCRVPVGARTDVTARFRHTRATVALTVRVSGTGGGTVSSDPAGINLCGATCTATYPVNTVVTLTADPRARSTFTGWSNACTGTGPCSVRLDEPTTVRAEFTRKVASPPAKTS